jgi:hypothetical protein
MRTGSDGGNPSMETGEHRDRHTAGHRRTTTSPDVARVSRTTVPPGTTLIDPASPPEKQPDHPPAHVRKSIGRTGSCLRIAGSLRQRP